MRGKTQSLFRRPVFFTAEFQDFSMVKFVQDHKKGKLLALRCHTLAVHFLHPVRKLVGLVAHPLFLTTDDRGHLLTPAGHLFDLLLSLHPAMFALICF